LPAPKNWATNVFTPWSRPTKKPSSHQEMIAPRPTPARATTPRRPTIIASIKPIAVWVICVMTTGPASTRMRR